MYHLPILCSCPTPTRSLYQKARRLNCCKVFLQSHENTTDSHRYNDNRVKLLMFKFPVHIPEAMMSVTLRKPIDNM
ncbi:hypothetical protein E2C01_000428 [Portunus trituberculatus]|uniref:Uncharacterized protein n=1 Tax=Portunus trituberculatus TaxID=210409 RepID=A0A5B7CE21_PORTR|nr:hypothetical protein [Portunus trituberculatus]